MTIILPEGTERAWNAAQQAGSVGDWNALAHNLLIEAAEERDPVVRGDCLTLALVACQHGFDLLAALDCLLRSLNNTAAVPKAAPC